MYHVPKTHFQILASIPCLAIPTTRAWVACFESSWRKRSGFIQEADHRKTCFPVEYWNFQHPYTCECECICTHIFMHMAKVLWICVTVFDKSKMWANLHTLCFFCGWSLVWGKRSDRMLTRGTDVAFQKNTFLSLASVCLSCQDPFFCFQLSLTAPLLPLPHLKWPPQWLALVLEQK